MFTWFSFFFLITRFETRKKYTFIVEVIIISAIGNLTLTFVLHKTKGLSAGASAT